MLAEPPPTRNRMGLPWSSALSEVPGFSSQEPRLTPSPRKPAGPSLCP